MFEQLEEKDPEHFAAPGRTKVSCCRRADAALSLISCGARLCLTFKELQELERTKMNDTLGTKDRPFRHYQRHQSETHSFVVNALHTRIQHLLWQWKADDAIRGGRLPVHERCLPDGCVIGRYRSLKSSYCHEAGNLASIILQSKNQLRQSTRQR